MLFTIICYFFCSRTPFSALRKFQFFSPFKEYLGGAHFTGFMLEPCTDLQDTSYLRNSVETVQVLIMELPFACKDELDNHARFIDTMLDPVCSLHRFT